MILVRFDVSCPLLIVALVELSYGNDFLPIRGRSINRMVAKEDSEPFHCISLPYAILVFQSLQQFGRAHEVEFLVWQGTRRCLTVTEIEIHAEHHETLEALE